MVIRARVKWPDCESDHSPMCSTKVKNLWKLPPLSRTANGVVLEHIKLCPEKQILKAVIAQNNWQGWYFQQAICFTRPRSDSMITLNNEAEGLTRSSGTTSDESLHSATRCKTWQSPEFQWCMSKILTNLAFRRCAGWAWIVCYSAGMFPQKLLRLWGNCFGVIWMASLGYMTSLVTFLLPPLCPDQTYSGTYLASYPVALGSCPCEKAAGVCS